MQGVAKLGLEVFWDLKFDWRVFFLIWKSRISDILTMNFFTFGTLAHQRQSRIVVGSLPSNRHRSLNMDPSIREDWAELKHNKHCIGLSGEIGGGGSFYGAYNQAVVRQKWQFFFVPIRSNSSLEAPAREGGCLARVSYLESDIEVGPF